MDFSSPSLLLLPPPSGRGRRVHLSRADHEIAFSQASVDHSFLAWCVISSWVSVVKIRCLSIANVSSWPRNAMDVYFLNEIVFCGNSRPVIISRLLTWSRNNWRWSLSIFDYRRLRRIPLNQWAIIVGWCQEHYQTGAIEARPWRRVDDYCKSTVKDHTKMKLVSLNSKISMRLVVVITACATKRPLEQIYKNINVVYLKFKMRLSSKHSPSINVCQCLF